MLMAIKPELPYCRFIAMDVVKKVEKVRNS